MSESRYQYVPTVWIDSNNQDSVFVDGRKLPQRLTGENTSGQGKKESEHIFSFNAEDNQYYYTYEYGYLNPASECLGNSKYIKTRIQNKQNSQFEVEQVIYRPQNIPTTFNMHTYVIEDGMKRQFLNCRYSRSKCKWVNVFLYPCTIKNFYDELLTTTEHPSQSYQQQECIQAALRSEDFGLEFVHQTPQGTYVTGVPVQVDEEVAPALYRYFDSKELPSLDDDIVTPESLAFYADLFPKV